MSNDVLQALYQTVIERKENPQEGSYTCYLLDKGLDKIPYFDLIYQYISDHNLQDIIVEFALFNSEVGIKKENIIVYELRTHY